VPKNKASEEKSPKEKPTVPSGPWRTIQEAAERMRVCDQTVRGLLHSGELRASRVGRRYLLDVADLDAFVLRRKRIVPPYRNGSRPWVSAMHAENRKSAPEKGRKIRRSR
jgi:excisionase family DNA binding protein